jgi:hypothetical protein
VDEQYPLSFEFAIMAGGFRSDSPGHAGLYARRESYELPSPVVLEHAAGHVIASTAPVRAHVAEFCREMARRKLAAPPGA